MLHKTYNAMVVILNISISLSHIMIEASPYSRNVTTQIVLV